MYDVRPTGPKHRQRFLCELRVPGFDYVAAGNSTVKKDAQTNAARDFVAFLVRQGLMQARFVTSTSLVNNFQLCSGSGSGLDPGSVGSLDPDSHSGSRRAKMTQKKSY